MEQILQELVGKTIVSISTSTSLDEQGDEFSDYIKLVFTDGTDILLRPHVWDFGEAAGIDVE